jgi:hypothetical protein
MPTVRRTRPHHPWEDVVRVLGDSRQHGRSPGCGGLWASSCRNAWPTLPFLNLPRARAQRTAS